MEESKSINTIRIHIWVTGRVQGVGFRSFVQKSALLFGLSGWVRNIGSDMVETVAEGARANLEKFSESVKSGPRSGRVDAVRIEWETASEEFLNFGIKFSL
jgi:acylphosphatase